MLSHIIAIPDAIEGEVVIEEGFSMLARVCLYASGQQCEQNAVCRGLVSMK